MDVDDLLWIHPLERSTWELTITLPRLLPLLQASPQGNQILEEAIHRGFTRYHPKDRLPMLPPEIEQQGSLLPDRERPSYSLFLPVTLHGSACVVGSAQLQRTQITPLAQLTYEQVDQALETDTTPLAQTLSLLYTVALRLQTQRRSQGAIGSLYDRRSGQISGEEGQPLPSLTAHRSHLIVSELMILANYTLASLAHRHQIPTLYRNHTAAEGRLDRLEKARYSPINQGHVGLGLAAYGHFTSPLRRAVDLINQLCTLELLLGADPWITPDQLSEQAEYLTQLPWEEHQQREDYYRQRTLRAAISTLQQGADLDSGQLQVLIKALYGQVSFPSLTDPIAPVLSPEIEQRLQIRILNGLKSGGIEQISLETLALVLTTPLDKPGWSTLRQQIAEQVFELPFLAAQIWNHWTQSEQQDPPVLSAEPLGSAHAPRWRITASYGDHRLQIERPHKKQAEQQALALLLARVGEIPLSIEALGSTPVTSPGSQTDKSSTNYKGRVLEWLAQRDGSEGATPEIQLHRIGGPDHHPLFQATVRLQMPTSEEHEDLQDSQPEIWVGEGRGESKKLAEQLAFQQIWERLQLEE